MTVALGVVSQNIQLMPHSPVCLFVLPCIATPLPMLLSFLFRLEKSLALAIKNLTLTLALLTYWANVTCGQCPGPEQKLQSPWGSMQQAGKALVKGQTILPLYCCSKQEGVCLCRSTENMKMEPRTWSMVTEMGKNNSYCKGAIFSNKNVFLFQQNVKLYILIYI